MPIAPIPKSSQISKGSHNKGCTIIGFHLVVPVQRWKSGIEPHYILDYRERITREQSRQSRLLLQDLTPTSHKQANE